MSINDPIIIWSIGALAAMIAWYVRRIEHRVSELESQMASHHANKELLDRMYNELQGLTKLTSRIAGHLNIS